MKLDCVVTSCNSNSLYADFIPLFVKAWNRLYPTIDIKIIYIDNYIPSNLEQYKYNLILFKPIDGVSTAFTSQYIRLLYPCILDYENGILITDMDMMPMNDSYYSKNIEQIDNNKFVYLRNVLLNDGEIAMCYNAALNTTWQDIFNINNIDDISNRIIEVNNRIQYADIHGGSGWSTDQKDLFNKVMEWNNKTGNLVILDDNKTGYRRLDRIYYYDHNVEKDKIRSGYYSDYHCFRPYSEYKEVNNAIVEALPVKEN